MGRSGANVFIGIDPGANGGLAAYKVLPEGHGVSFHSNSGTNRWVLDWLRRTREDGQPYAMLEKIPTAIFGTDKSSMSKLYGSYKGLEMALDALEIPYQLVEPKEWMRGLGIPPRRRSGIQQKGEKQSAWKNRLKAKAQELFPSLKITLATSDALCIAYYNRLKNGGE